VGFQCATARVPRDYDRPRGATLEIPVTRLPAQDRQNRIGSLFVNFGGPGGPGVEPLQLFGAELFASLNDRFDIVAFDPRGTSAGAGQIDCAVNQETEGLYGQPFVTPETLDVGALVARKRAYAQRCAQRNADLLPYVATADVARDMEVLRRAVGDDRLTYLGFSYGTYLGTLYARFYPDRVRALVLDGAVDPEQNVDRPLEIFQESTAGFERALGRFFQACAAHKDVCPFGGDDPHDAFDVLLERLDATPLPAGGPHPVPVSGDDLRAAAVLVLYAKQAWPLLGEALAQAEAGDGTLVRTLTDMFYGWQPDGSYDPFGDAFFAIQGVDARWPRDVGAYLKTGERSWRLFDHFFFNSGYSELAWGLLDAEARGAYFGPFRLADSVPAPLVVGTTYDPSTPYRAAKALVSQLGTGRLLTMRGDGHTAYANGSPCIDAAVEAYLEQRALPAAGTVCRQDVPFAALPAQPTSAAGAERLLRKVAPRVAQTLEDGGR